MDKYQNLSIRARVVFGGLCLENLLCSIGEAKEEWTLVLDTIWEYSSGDAGKWHYKMSELTPFSIEEDIPFERKDFQYFTVEEYNALKKLYSRSGNDLKEIVGLIFEIGTKDLYSSITLKSPETLKMLERIVDLLNEKKCTVPNVDDLVKYSIDEQGGWGIKFFKRDIGL